MFSRPRPQLLRRVLHSSERGEARAEALAELKGMLQHTPRLTDAARADIGEAIRELEKGQRQQQALQRARIVGVTCAACVFPVLAGR